MTEKETVQIPDTLEEQFPGAITRDERQGYDGYIVEAAKLIEIAKSLRDDMGYDYLSSVTGVDYLPDDKMEVVYHLYRSAGGQALTLKIQTPRDDSVVPSLVSIYPGADFQEREAWDLFRSALRGIRISDAFSYGTDSTAIPYARIGRNHSLRRRASLLRADGRKVRFNGSRIPIHSARTFTILQNSLRKVELQRGKPRFIRA